MKQQRGSNMMTPRQQRRMDNRREIATGGRIQAPQRPPMQQRPAPVQVMGQQGMQTPTAGADAGMAAPMGQGYRLPVSKPGTEMGQNVYRPQGQGIVAGEMDSTSPGRAWGGRPQGPGFAGQFGGGMPSSDPQSEDMARQMSSAQGWNRAQAQPGQQMPGIANNPYDGEALDRYIQHLKRYAPGGNNV